MGIVENIVSAFQNVLSNKMRSALTVLGIIIGIAAVIMITGIGGGLEYQTNSQLSQLGLEAIVVSLKGGDEIKNSDFLTLEDKEVLKMPSEVTYVSPVVEIRGTVRLKNPEETKRCSVMGIDNEYRFTQPVTLLSGRFINDIDVQNRSNVVVIDNVLARKVFGTENCLGQKVFMNLRGSIRELDVVGVTEGIDYGSYYDIPANVYMPVTTVMGYNGNDTVAYYYVALSENVPEKANRAMEEIRLLLDNKHKNTNKYNIQNMKNQMERIGDILGYITSFVALVASISLIVGGIGVMNIMLVTVTERTREIGIRKSLGATDSNIRTQFLFEAMILTFLGGVIGILLGIAGSFVIGAYVDLTPVLSPVILVGTVLISSAIGIVFGVYPASKAARLDPIEALRYE